MDKFVIFDMDGVIVDSEYIFLSTKNEMLIDEGIDTDITYQYQFMGMTFEHMWKIMKKEKNLKKEISEYIEEMNKRREVLIQKDGIKPIKGIKDFINFLKKQGYTIAVASSSPKHEIIRNLKALEIDEYFTVKVSGQEVENSKPAPDIFLRAAELLGANPEKCIVFEDTKNGSTAAKSAGMYCIGFANPDYPAQDLKVCDKIITKYEEIYEFFEKNN